jgi:hypothetical protein
LKKLILIGALCALSSHAFAEAKHVKFTTEVVIDGVAVVNEVKCPMIAATPTVAAHRDCQTPFTVGELAYMSLERAPGPGVAQQSWTDAVKHDDLAHAIRNADDYPLLDDQRIMIQSAMGPIWSPAILGFVARVIDPPAPAAPSAPVK